jgi:glucokinase
VTKAVRHDAVAARAVQMFVGYPGAFIGDLVLAFGAWVGVHLGGAIPRALQIMLSDPAVRQRLTAKSAFHRQLSEVPVAIVSRSDLVLFGAVAALSTG